MRRSAWMLALLATATLLAVDLAPATAADDDDDDRPSAQEVREGRKAKRAAARDTARELDIEAPKGYLVYFGMVLKLPAGTKIEVDGENEKCAYDIAGYQATLTDDTTRKVMTFGASTSIIPPCFSAVTYVRYTVTVDEPFKGRASFQVLQKASGSDYEILCDNDWGLRKEIWCDESGMEVTLSRR